MPTTPTARQLEVLSAIRSSVATRGYPPTLRELGSTLGIKSTNGVSDHIRALERKGFVRCDSGARTITLTDMGRAAA